MAWKNMLTKKPNPNENEKEQQVEHRLLNKSQNLIGERESPTPFTNDNPIK